MMSIVGQEALSHLATAVPEQLRHAPLYNTVISSCLHEQQTDMADNCFEAMSRDKVPWDAITWSLAIRQQVQ